MRTDLDSFTEVEAYALMASGYLMTECQLKQLDHEHKLTHQGQRWGGFDVHARRETLASGETAWPFAQLFEIMGKPPADSDLRRHDLGIQLAVSRELFGKVWRLDSRLQRGALVLALAVLAGTAYLAGLNADATWTTPQYTLTVAQFLLAVLLAVVALAFPAFKLLRIKKAGRSWAIKVLVATVGVIACKIHLWLFDPVFLRRGKLDGLLRLGGAAPATPLAPFIPDNQPELTPGQSVGELVSGHEELDKAST